MSETCDLLTAYVDGELDAAEAEAFALHLDGCETCPAALHEALQMVALEAEARLRVASAGDGETAAATAAAATAVATAAAAPTTAAASAPPPAAADAPIPISRARDRRSGQRTFAIAGIALASAAAAAVLFLVARPGGPGSPGIGSAAGGDVVALATAPTRALEGRISHRGAAAHRPYAVGRSGGPAAAEPISLETLAQLEKRGDQHGLGAAQLLLGDPARALASIDRAAAGPSPGPGVESDRALALLAAGKQAEALAALDAILARAPAHPQALWNRALALRDLELPLSAAAAFEAVAALGEPGWADEAKRRAGELTAAARERREAYDRMTAAGGKLAAAPDALTAADARRFSGVARSFFYEAVRGAASAELVQRLAPLAQELDAIAGDDRLSRYVAATARADFARRGPLAARYAKLVAGERLDEAAGRAFLAELRSAGPAQGDLLLGALFRASPDGRSVPTPLHPELRRLTRASGDPWFELLATEQEVNALVAAGDYGKAEVALLRALEGCAPRWLEFRCARLELQLASGYAEMVRLPEAERIARAVWARARRLGDWHLERRVLQLLANIEALGGEAGAAGAQRLAMVRAYVGELARRNPDLCADLIWGRQVVATMLVNRQDLVGAKRELDEMSKLRATCPQAKPHVSSVFTQVHVLRDLPATAPEIAALREEIATLRTGASPATRALLDHSEGRLLVERDRAAATQLFQAAIAVAREAPEGDALAHKARAFSYSVLVLDAARAGEWPRVWQLLGDEAGFQPAPRCALGVAADDGRALAVVADAAGAVHGWYDGARRTPIPAAGDADVRTLVPDGLRAKLAGCEQVEVMARAPIHGAPELLGPDIAWSYRSGRSTAPAAPAPGGGGTLVIANTEPPASLGLPRLTAWRSTLAPDRIVEGSGATPARALAELASARYAELHVHGMVNTGAADATFLTMSPEADGHYALTAEMIRKQPLRAHPVVVLAACHAADTAPYLYQPWSLPAALVEAGARAVFAATGVVDDADAGAFFDDLRARLDRGTPPAIALRDARKEWLAAHPAAAWVRALMVFQ